MTHDETQIRALVQEWHRATQAGDIARVLGLMTDDVLFLLPGRAPMDKKEFAALSSPVAGARRPTISIDQTIHEVEVAESLAFMRSSLTVTVTPLDGAVTVARHGSTLTVFRKVAGKWLLARDANLFAMQEKPGDA